MRYFLKVKYKGTAFHGSQLQGDLPTVQLEINKALSVLLRSEILSFGASRTDAGVHALGNYYHFDTEKNLTRNFQYRLNAVLPHELSVENVFMSKVPEANARFDALSRRYRYRIYFKKDPFLYHRALFYPYKINEILLEQTAQEILRHSNFESFSKRNTQSKTFQCNIRQSFWERREGELHYVVEANRFLRGMVRALVGTQLQVARGKISPAEFKAIIEAKDCTLADFSVAGHGLYLESIKYPEDYLLELKEDL
jgi:tRNA pseudouridine38-40 synthase